jgi:hypothetical protein
MNTQDDKKDDDTKTEPTGSLGWKKNQRLPTQPHIYSKWNK